MENLLSRNPNLEKSQQLSTTYENTEDTKVSKICSPWLQESWAGKKTYYSKTYEKWQGQIQSARRRLSREP